MNRMRWCSSICNEQRNKVNRVRIICWSVGFRGKKKKQDGGGKKASLSWPLLANGNSDGGASSGRRASQREAIPLPQFNTRG
jgi:hypothetical protein